jgi:hypothetical protein
MKTARPGRSPRFPVAGRLLLAGLAVLLGGPVARGQQPAAEVRLDRGATAVTVTLGGRPFTSYVFAGHAKPILFPVHGPDGVPVTRSWPMVADVAGEPHDHPHHESFWFTHGSVNGIDFWAHKADAEGRRPRIEHAEITACTSGPTGVLETTNRWLAADGKVVCTDARRIEFAGDDAVRTIDFAVTVRADHGPLVFGDTKEGAFGLRVRPGLQLKNSNGSQGAAGHMVNSAGERDAAVWGRAARWVDYHGPLDGRPVGVAILDHPANLRHPSHWHARDYGLFAANPFGLHDFTGAAKGAGDHTVPAGGTLALRYRVVLHRGDAAEAGIEERWRAWAGPAAGRAAP